MDSALSNGLIAVGVVVVLAWWARRSAAARAASAPPRPVPAAPAPVAEESPEAAEDAADDDGHVIAVTTEGEAFLVYARAVRLLPPEDEGEGWKVGAGIASANLRGALGLSTSWHAGELTGARVVQGGADEGAWRLETLGREGEYGWFPFETREGAEAARASFERVGVVRLGTDESGRPMPPSGEQYAEARRLYLETMAELDADDEGTR